MCSAPVTGSPARVCTFFIQREMVALATGSLSSPDWRAVQGWQSSPVPPGVEEPEVVVVEWELTAREARGPFTLKLWDESGKRLVTLGNVTFP